MAEFDSNIVRSPAPAAARAVWATPELIDMKAGMADVQNKVNSTPDAALGQSILS